MWRKKHALLWHFYKARKNKSFWESFQLNSTKCEEKCVHMTNSPTFAVLHSLKKIEKPSVSSSNISDSRNIFMQ